MGDTQCEIDLATLSVVWRVRVISFDRSRDVSMHLLFGFTRSHCISGFNKDTAHGADDLMFGHVRISRNNINTVAAVVCGSRTFMLM